MHVRIYGALAMAAFAVTCLLGSTQSSIAQKAYITNSGSDTVSVINTATNTVIATIPISTNTFEATGVTVTWDGSKVYITSGYKGSGYVSVIDTAINKVTATIFVWFYNGPLGLAATPNGSKLYVANDAGVEVIDTATNTVAAGIVTGLISATGVAVTPDGSKVYIAGFLAGDGPAVSVIATATDKVIATIPVPGYRSSNLAVFPYGVAVSRDNRKVYVATPGYKGAGFTSSVSVIDVATDKVSATISLGNYDAFAIAVSLNGARVYVTDEDGVSVIDTAINKVIATIPVGSYPEGVGVTTDGTKVYVANEGSNTVSVINTATNKVTATIPVGNGPIAFGVFMQPELRFAGTPGGGNCVGKSVAALLRDHSGFNTAAADLGYSSVAALDLAVLRFCDEAS